MPNTPIINSINLKHLVFNIAKNTMSADNKKKFLVTMSGVTGAVAMVSFLLNIYCVILYTVLNNNGDTSKMKDLLLVYLILQTVTCMTAIVFCGSSSYGCICHFMGLNVVAILILFVLVAIIGVISIVSTIGMSGWISYEFFAYPWTNAFVSYTAMLFFVIILLIVHSAETIGLILVPIGIVVGGIYFLRSSLRDGGDVKYIEEVQ